MTPIDPATRTELEAAAFRRLVEHLRERTDVQNIDLMNLAGFCRNCLSRWYREAAESRDVILSDPEAREIVYGMPYKEWQAKHQRAATPEQQAAFSRLDRRPSAWTCAVPDDDGGMPWRAVVAAMCGVLVGIGFARFAYAPLLPVLIAQGWFAPGAAAYLGAANLLGYLAGALAASAVAARFRRRPWCGRDAGSRRVARRLLRADAVRVVLRLAAAVRDRRRPADDPGALLRDGACAGRTGAAWPAG